MDTKQYANSMSTTTLLNFAIAQFPLMPTLGLDWVAYNTPMLWAMVTNYGPHILNNCTLYSGYWCSQSSKAQHI